MSSYRHSFRPGCTYFFTLSLRDPQSTLLTRNARLLGESAADVEGLYPFETVAAVLLPGHMHLIAVLPEGDKDHFTRIKALRSGFTRRLAERLPRRERPIPDPWKRRYWDYLIRDISDFTAHIAYLHGNPVKHGLAKHPDDWPYSTWHRFKTEEIAPWSADDMGTVGEA
ncbi:MAG: transposase [Pseudomonadota bacterium]